LLVGLSFLAANALPAQAAPPSRANLVRSDRTPGLQHADKLRPADRRRQLTIGVNLALRNEAQLEAFIAQVSDRESANYGHYMTPDQFAAAYGPTQAQVQKVVDQLRASGLSVGAVSGNRTIVEATGPVSSVEAAFGVTISDWHDRDQNRDFFGNDTEPTLPAAVASYVVGVAGLNNHYPLHRLGPTAKVGGGPAGGYTPTELKKAYDVTPLASAGYTGSGQPLGLFELDGFRQSNISTYDTQYGLGSPAPTRVLINGGPGPLGGGEIEVELDVEVMHAIASASPITVWEGPNTDPGVNATYNAIVTSNTTRSNSTSWGICEPNTTQAEMTTLDNIFKQAATQGQSFFAASGDYGAYDCGDSRLTVDSPANDPYMTGTGGTALTLNTDGTYKSETSWANTNTSPSTGSGGGVSSYFARPSWQTGPGVANSSSNGKRQVPDVSLDADPRTGYSAYVTNNRTTGWNVVGGTSAAAPAWAAFAGAYNQYAAANGMPNLGYANPALYSIGSSTQPYRPYHDVTTGDDLFYSATSSWDYPTGWGSYDAYNLARDLAPNPYSVGAVGTDNSLWTLTSDSTSFTWKGGGLSAAPAVVSIPRASGPSGIVYIVTGADHDLWVRSETLGWQRLFDIPVYCIDNPAGVVISGIMYVACQGSDRALWHAEGPAPLLQSLPSLNKAAWQSLGGTLTAGPAVAQVAGNPMYFALGSDRRIYTRGSSSGYVATNWACVGHPAAATVGTTSYFACHGADGALWYATYSASWSDPKSLGGQILDGPGIAANQSAVNFFVEGTDGSVWHRALNTGWTKDPSSVQFGVGATGS
jgi:kumamolisin